ncbi:MAG: hypothetical protein AAGG11_19420, partial [Pseudomonadota bacterium]
MNVRAPALLTLTLLSTACTGMIQYASISEAYKTYDRGSYEKTLRLIAQAENTRHLDVEQRVGLAYLKAQAHEGLGQADRAATLYAYICEQHPTSQYAYLIRDRQELTERAQAG